MGIEVNIVKNNDMIRFGVIGLRRGQSFVRVCQAVGGATVTALYDIDGEWAAAVAAEFGARPFYRSTTPS